MRQLQLNIEPQLDAKISDFSGPSWSGVIDAVRQLHTGLIQQFYIYGDAGIGKSHLLSAICDSYLELGKSAIHVSLLELLDAPIEAITSLERYDLVALDDIETISGVKHWQKAVFHLINYNNQEGGRLIFSSRNLPIELKLELPDLQSRLMQAVSVRLPDGNLYEDRAALIQSVLNRRGILLDHQIVEYLLDYGPHKTALLLQILERLENLLKGEKTKLSNATLRQIYAFIDEYKSN
jgi:DnaA-homolog protein